jgi:hypothetical protein
LSLVSFRVPFFYVDFVPNLRSYRKIDGDTCIAPLVVGAASNLLEPETHLCPGILFGAGHSISPWIFVIFVCIGLTFVAAGIGRYESYVSSFLFGFFLVVSFCFFFFVGLSLFVLFFCAMIVFPFFRIQQPLRRFLRKLGLRKIYAPLSSDQNEVTFASDEFDEDATVISASSVSASTSALSASSSSVIFNPIPQAPAHSALAALIFLPPPPGSKQ